MSHPSVFRLCRDLHRAASGIAYETAPGAALTRTCACGRAMARSGTCVLCLLESAATTFESLCDGIETFYKNRK